MEKVEISKEQLENIIWFIRSSLESEWDSYTDRFICSDPHEVGVRRMNPQMYDLMVELENL